MNLPPGIFHQSFCVALAKCHSSISVRAADPTDKEFHGRRADAFTDCLNLPPTQLRMVINLTSRFPKFVFVRDRLVTDLRVSPAGESQRGILKK